MKNIKSKQNIIILGSVKLSNFCNGTASFSRDIITGLKKKGCDVKFYSLGDFQYDSRIGRLFSKIRWRYIKFSIKYKLSWIFVVDMMFSIVTFTRTLSKKNMHGSYLCNDILSAQAALFLTKRNVTLICHFNIAPWDEFVRGGYIKANSIGYLLLRKWMLIIFGNKRLNFIYVSKDTKEVVCSLLDSTRTEGKLIYNGIYVDNNNAGERLTKHKYIINVGSICYNKNQELFVEVAYFIHKVLPDMHFVLVGDGNSEYVNLLKKKINDAGMSNNFIFTGILNKTETYNAMSQAELYFHTSLSESFGRVLVEAMGNGVLTCCMEYPAAYEILGEDSRLAFPLSDTASQIGTKIALLLNDSTRLEETVKQKKIFDLKFSEEKMINEFYDYIYDEL